MSKITTYTSAPVDYDGFGTETVCIAGVVGGKQVRKVATPAEHAEWQRNRYWSGSCYLVKDSAEWEALVRYGLVVDAGNPLLFPEGPRL